MSAAFGVIRLVIVGVTASSLLWSIGAICILADGSGKKVDQNRSVATEFQRIGEKVDETQKGAAVERSIQTKNNKQCC